MTNWKGIKEEWETTKITLADLAEKHGIKLGTLKSRKSREKWSRDATKKDATKTKKVATIPSKDATVRNVVKSTRYPNGHPGNSDPPNQFTERNQAARKHGLFSRYIPKETLEIMGMLDKNDPADLIWDQIQLQYAAIIRSQEIMFVESKDEMIKELKKAKYEYYPRSEEDGGGVEKATTEEEYEFQFAWERQAQLLTAQSRAIGELRSSIRQFVEMADRDDERRLKLEQMQLNIDKTKAEIEKLGSDDQNGPIEIKIIGKKRE